ncbi:hypothetical protein DU475_05220 [Rhodopseudomonas sp. WA056]|nr:hypothetical protein [Rhodopseudomonas sp. WA056]
MRSPAKPGVSKDAPRAPAAMVRDGASRLLTMRSCRWPSSGSENHIFRWSFTRTALPCERGTSPGDFTATLQVTPISDLM